MAQRAMALFDGKGFRIDPTAVSWNYTVKAQEIKTVGGKVIQVYGTDLGDMTVRGSFGAGGHAEQERFLSRMKELADRQVIAAANRHLVTAQPSRFIYPPRGWDFRVYLKAYSQPGAPGASSVYVEPGLVAPQWELRLHMVGDQGAQGIKKAAQNAFIERLSQGLGWNEDALKAGFHGTLTSAEVQTLLNGQSVTSYIGGRFGLSSTAPTGQPTGGG
jgi:hypothetical protein